MRRARRLGDLKAGRVRSLRVPPRRRHRPTAMIQPRAGAAAWQCRGPPALGLSEPVQQLADLEFKFEPLLQCFNSRFLWRNRRHARPVAGNFPSRSVRFGPADDIYTECRIFLVIVARLDIFFLQFPSVFAIV